METKRIYKSVVQKRRSSVHGLVISCSIDFKPQIYEFLIVQAKKMNAQHQCKYFSRTNLPQYLFISGQCCHFIPPKMGTWPEKGKQEGSEFLKRNMDCFGCY